jgi:hypothetical protein
MEVAEDVDYGYGPAAEKEADGVWRSLVER